jgi:hypothetical protein
MADSCEHLEYRDAGNDTQFDRQRPFCTVVGEFVQPMRADICAARHDLAPAEDCEYYRQAHDLGSVTGFDGHANRAGASDGGDANRAGASDGGDAECVEAESGEQS